MKTIHKTTKFIFIILAVMLAAACTSNRNSNEIKELVVLHTNDHHGTVIARTGFDRITRGGLAERATLVKQTRLENENVLLLDAGDINNGQALSNMFNAEPDIKVYGMMNYNAATVGNHEFDKGVENFRNQIKQSKFPWLSANIKYDGKYLDKPYIIKKYNGFTVGIFGITTLRTLEMVSEGWFPENIEFLPEIETAKKTVETLRKKKVDIVIALVHMGDIAESKTHTTSLMMAEQVDGIDLIIDGHAHSLFEEPKTINGTHIVTANQWGSYVGEAKFKIQNKNVIGFEWYPIEITSTNFQPDKETENFIAQYTDKADAYLKKVIAKSSDEFPYGNKLPRYMETAAGDLLCDAYVWQMEQLGVHADFAVTNSGGIRAALPKGDITRGDIMTMVPYENYVSVLTMSGKDVRLLFDAIGAMNQGAGGFTQVSKGVSYTITYDRDGKNGKISNVLLDGKPIDDNKTYKVATHNFLAGGGDGFAPFANATATFISPYVLNEALTNYIESLPEPIAPKTYGRITIVGGVQISK